MQCVFNPEYSISKTETANDWTYTVDYAFGGTNSETLEVVDGKAKDWLVNYLLLHNFKYESIHETANLSHIDLAAERDGVYYFFELKKRWVTSKTYNDAIIDGEKYKYITESRAKLPENMTYKIILVNFYTDGFVWFFNFDDADLLKTDTMITERTHEKKTGSKRLVKLQKIHYPFSVGRCLFDNEIKKLYN